ncbi:MAG TPA: Calx-beta domain-containing protein, partial [Pyrinomonadaceae bacterium]|nr:Calx-beta domain-containing protein [Pyrinomonadaceae bacterium]
GGFGNVSLGSNSSGATVQGNYIGTDVTGNVALTNPKPGISIQSSGHTVGGTAAGARNVISGNTIGIQIGGNTTAQVGANLIQGNFIGLNQAGSALPNAAEGIRIENSPINGPANNVIGGTANGAANTIAFNGSTGVFVSSGTADSIRGNAIFSNGGLGIDVAPAGITANDQGDGDTGANNRQNFPVLTSLTPSANPTTINGTLNSAASTTFTIDFYTNTTCDLSGNGEGAQYLASTTITTAADGNAAINFTLGSALPAGTIITATATDPGGNTSEFSPCLSGAFISFNQSSYAVTEGDGSLNVTVNRTGDTAVPVSVDYATSDAGASAVSCATPGGKASAKCDFTDAFGTVQFAAGETSKTISVLITQDNYVEGPEAFTIGLSNAVAATLQAPSSATITINDEVTEPPGNAIDDAGTFVRQHYHDFLNREPDQSGFDFWTAQITSCGGDPGCTEVKRINVSAAFFLSIEFQQTGYLVERMYKVAYGDATGTSTLGGTSHNLAVPTVRFAEFLKDTQRIGQGVVVLAPGWEQALENNKQAYALEFVSTIRFATAYPTTMTPTQFVDLFNQHAGNVLSLSERNAAISLFGGAGNTGNLTVRAQVLRQVAEDQDLYNAESNRAFVLAEYFGYLRRNPNDPQDPDYTGYEFWLTKLNQFNGNYIAAEMVKAFISSIEYRQRFGQ